MKSLFKFTCVAATALLLFSACSEKESNHIFTTKYEGLMDTSDEEEAKARYDMICKYITSVDPDYFGKNHSYFGLSYDADTTAWTDFVLSCNKIDTVVAKSFLIAGEQFRVNLVETADDSYRIVGAYLIYKEEDPEAEKKE